MSVVLGRALGRVASTTPGATLDAPPTVYPAPRARDAAGVTVHHNFQTGHGWTFLASTTGSLNETAGGHVVGTQCAWFQGNGDNAVRGMRRTGFPSVNLTGRSLGLLLRVDNPNNIPQTGASFLIYLGNSAFANFLTISLSYDGAYKFFPRRTTYANAFGGSWQYVTIPLDSGSPLAAYMSVSGAQTAAQILANVTDWQIYHRDPNPSTATRISVQEIFSIPVQTAYPNGVCCLTFDDGYASCLTKAVPNLGGAPATLYMINDVFGEAGYLTPAQLSTLQNVHGWAIAHHAYGGVAHNYPGYSGVTPEAGVADVQLGRQWLKVNGYRAYDHLAYPHGSLGLDSSGVGTENDRADINFAPYFQTARLVYNKMPETIPPADPMKLRTYWATSNTTTLVQMQAFADIAKRTKSAMICVFHDIADSGPLGGAQWLTSDFAAFVTYLGTIGMPIRTIPEVFGVT